MCEACYKKVVRRLKDPLVGTRPHAKSEIKNLLTGKRFGKWLVGTPVCGQKNKALRYLCTCDCGAIKEVAYSTLIHQGSTQCRKCYFKERSTSFPEYLAAYRKACRHIAYFSNFPMEISFEQYVEFTKQVECHYCGAEVTWEKFLKKDQSPPYNLDRKDNEKGYTIDNVVVCCKVCNYTKANRFTYEEFLLIGHVLRLVRQLRDPLPKDQMNFMHTFSGKMFKYLNPDPEDICIEDIAHGLSQLNRFVGQTVKPYSVAQHSVLVSQTCPKEFALYGLLHDASEAYVNDLCRVLKQSPGMGIYKWYENLAMSAVCKKFGLPEKEPAEVKTADLVLLLTEKRDLFKNVCLWAVNKYDGTSHLEPLKKKIRPWTAEEAEEKFLERFAQLNTVCN